LASSQQVCLQVENAGVDVRVMLSAVNAELRDCWQLERYGAARAALADLGVKAPR